MHRKIRNVAIIAHVDHGKTTLVDKMLYQSGMFRSEQLDQLAGGENNLIMDSNPLERERGITILAKNCSITYTAIDRHKYKINIIDTPGHADFGGEVERVLKMADGVLLLVDAFEGPMPQTRFVLSKALGYGLRPIVVVNKVDRPDSRPHEVESEVFDLLVELGADDSVLDFPTLFASAKEGWATPDLSKRGGNLRPLFEAVIKHVPPPSVDTHAPLQILVTTLDYSDYVGRIAIGRVFAGELHLGKSVVVIDRSGKSHTEKPQSLLEFEGLGRKEVKTVRAGDICAVVGLEEIDIGNTITDPENPRALPPIAVDEPTLHMTFRVNDGPFAGRDGTYVTSRQIKERLDRQLRSDVALWVSPGDTPDEFNVSGRGLMHLGILLENMRREGFELCAGKPKVILKEINGATYEPIERLAISCPLECQSSVMSLLGDRRAEMTKMDVKAGMTGFIYMEFKIPARGLIGLRGRMMNATGGRAIMHHTFYDYEPMRGDIPQRQAGVLVATHTGMVTAYALDGLYDRGVFFVKPGEDVYEGQIVGEFGQDKDIGVNVVRARHLTNIRSSNKDDSARVRPMREMTLEMALEYIQDDELVEITPKAVRMRKRLRTDIERRRAMRQKAGAA
jgi:GTP-binding protein